MEFLKQESLEVLQKEAFWKRQPCPWFVHDNLISAEGYSRLRETFPVEDMFEQHRDLPRPHKQRPHNRLYLAYKKSIYHDDILPLNGVLDENQISPEWSYFIQELNSSFYSDWACSIFHRKKISIRFAWHMGIRGSEVSPHVDSDSKIATHIFYFNDRDDWEEDWGGETLLLCKKKGKHLNPEFEDFEEVISTCPCIGNRALLFMNGVEAWHGVRKLDCPQEARRRIFTVVFEVPSV